MSLFRRVLALAVLLVALLVPVQAFADGEFLVPVRPAGVEYPAGRVPVYDNPLYPITQYRFDRRPTDPANQNVPFLLTNAIETRLSFVNTLLLFKAWLLKVVIRVVDYALNQNFFDPIISGLAPVRKAIGQHLWEAHMVSRVNFTFIEAPLALTGLWALILFLRGKASRVWGLLGGTVLILVVMGLALAIPDKPTPEWNPSTSSTTIPDARFTLSEVRSLSLSVYDAANAATQGTSQWGLFVSGSDAAWDALILQPWVAGEFGVPTSDVTWGTYLSKVTNRTNQNLACMKSRLATETDPCPWWDDSALPARTVVALTSTAFTAVYAGALFMIAGGIIVAQLWFVLLVLLLPVWLLVALWLPETGPALARRICFKALGALISQGVLAAALAALLVLTQTVDGLFGSGGAFAGRGWVLEGIVLDLLAILAFQFRFTWLAPFSLKSPRHESAGDGSLVRQIRSWVDRRSSSAVTAAERAEAAVAAVAAGREPAPAFQALRAPEVHVEAPAATLDALVTRPESTDLPLRQRPPQEAFLSQMRGLRQRMGINLNEAPVMAGTGPQPAPGGWEEPSPTTPPSSGSARAVERTGREQIPEASRAPRQRPRT